jgi:hypothetical protein
MRQRIEGRRRTRTRRGQLRVQHHGGRGQIGHRQLHTETEHDPWCPSIGVIACDETGASAWNTLNQGCACLGDRVLPTPLVRTLLMTSMELDMTTYNNIVTATLHVYAARPGA